MLGGLLIPLLYGLVAPLLTYALLGLFELRLDAGGLVVTKRPVRDGHQPVLPYFEAVDEEDGPPHAQSPAQLSARVAEPAPSRVERLARLSEGELATLARAMLAALQGAETASLLARHEAGGLLTSPAHVFELLSPEMGPLSQEQLRVITLTTRHQMLGTHLVYQGTANSSPVRPAEVFRPAVVQQAPALIVAHNHPSGDPTPSADDHSLTRRLHRVGETLGVRLVDHIVITQQAFYSFRENGHIPIGTGDQTSLSDLTTSPQTSVYATSKGMLPQAHHPPFPEDDTRV